MHGIFAFVLLLGLFAPAASGSDTTSGGAADSGWAPPVPAGAAAPDTLGGDARTGATPRRDYLAEMRANFTKESRAYSGIKTTLRLVTPLYGILVALLVLFSGLAGKLRDVAHNLGRSRWVRVLVFLALYTGVAFLLEFPLLWYNGFALERQFGLSSQSLGLWLGDQGKALLLGLFVLGVVPILWLAYTAIARSPRRWWLWLAIGSFPVITAGTLLEPLVIDPVFNKFTPLRDRHLESRIVDLAERAGIPGSKVYEVNKSRQTRKYNAYVNGFGASQRIVLWDTTLEGMEEDEILFVMGHEIGHYVLGHVWKGIAFTSALSLLLLWLCARIARWAVSRFGEAWGFRELHDVASLPLLAASVSLVVFLAQPLVNGYSRSVETEADLYGLEITRDNDAAARAFLRLGAQNKSNPEPSATVRLVLYTHPTLAERVRLALRYRPWEEGRPNRYHRASPGGGQPPGDRPG